MLFRHPGRYKFDGNWYDYVVVPFEKVNEYCKRGWSRTLAEALAAGKPPATTILKKRKINQLTRPEIQEIASVDGSIKELSERFNISTYAVKKIKNGEL